MKLTRLFLFLLLVTNSVFAQLGNFGLQITKTDETCLGNGTLTITPTNVTPSASMLYKIYKLPNQSNPVSVQTNGYVTSLTGGNYKIVAIQALGSQSATKEQNITIVSNIVNFAFTVSSANQNCATGGSLIINPTSGIGSAYEIIAGPVTKPLQSSNIFEGLPGGTYKIRAYDVCGTAKVKTYTFSLQPSTLSISDTYYTESSTICDSITVNNLISPSSGAISYPLAAKFTLVPMDMAGEPIVIEEVYSTGDPDSLVVSAVVPRFITESYTYELRITDHCDLSYEKINNVVDPSIEVALDKAPLLCAERYLKVSAFKHMAPFKIEFLSAPDGFTAEAFNPAGEGPFTDDVINYGNENLAVPFGNYIVKITDACGRTAQDTLLLEFEPLQPSVRGRNNGCFSLFGKINISISQQKLITAKIITAPSTYTGVLPQDVTAKISSEGTLTLLNMPIGTYTITFTDNCGFTYTKDVEVPPFVEKEMSITTLPDCTPGFGTVKLKGGNGKLVSVFMTAAPVGYSTLLPLDVSDNIVEEDGDFYMNNLPSGSYSFTATDICGVTEVKVIEVIGYIPPQVNSVVFTPNCGSYSVKVNDTGNGSDQASYWLQRYNPATGTWGHPASNVAYAEGAVPTTGNSTKLTNNIPRSNLTSLGQFRVIKKFETYGSGTADKTICISILGEFTFNDAFAISNAYTLACAGNPNDVFIDAVGYNVTYRIEKKNDAVFVVDNGFNNVFINLEPAIYLFSIEDDCGNKLAKEFNLNELPSIADATKPLDMNICVEEGSAGSHTFYLPEQNSQILGALPAAIYTITYHLSQEDADNGVNALPDYYTNTVNGQKIYARLVNNHITLCYGTTSFALFVGEYPQAQISTTGTICNDGKLTLTASAGFDNYIWSTGETTRTIFVNKPGIYTVQVQKEYGNRICEAPLVEVEIFGSSAPSKITIDTEDWTRDQNVITVNAEGAGQYEYSLDGITYQDSNVFPNLECGAYQVYVKDKHGCGVEMKEVVLLHYPNFFTPNGDGVHDKWRIKYSPLEPHLHVTIFDRYGKIITSFGATSEGWDGTLNGTQLPSTDYWFVVTREDGRELKGHFAMLR